MLSCLTLSSYDDGQYKDGDDDDAGDNYEYDELHMCCSCTLHLLLKTHMAALGVLPLLLSFEENLTCWFCKSSVQIYIVIHEQYLHE